jgi:hypothetical protein
MALGSIEIGAAATHIDSYVGPGKDPQHWGSSAGQFHLVALPGQFVCQGMPMVPLNDDDTVFYGTATAAVPLKARRQCFQVAAVEIESGNGGHALSPAPFHFAPDSQNAVTGSSGGCCLLAPPALALFGRVPALGTDSPLFGRVDPSRIIHYTIQTPDVMQDDTQYDAMNKRNAHGMQSDNF